MLIAKIINNIPNNTFIREIKVLFGIIIPTQNIITGILNIITITLPKR